MSGPVWQATPQSAQAAEHVGLAYPSQLMTGPYEAISDSSGAVNVAGAPYAKKVSPKAVFSGIWKSVAHLPGFAHMQAVRHIKAHQTAAVKAALPAESLAEVHLNEAADTAAKALARELSCCLDLQKHVKGECRVALAVVRTIAAVILAFPKPKKFDRLPPIMTKDERAIVKARKKAISEQEALAYAIARSEHAWESVGSYTWRCFKCLQVQWNAHRPCSAGNCRPPPALDQLRREVRPSQQLLMAVPITRTLHLGGLLEVLQSMSRALWSGADAAGALPHRNYTDLRLRSAAQSVASH